MPWLCGQGCIEGDPLRFSTAHGLIGGLTILDQMAVLFGVADANAPSSDEVSGQSGGGSKHAHGVGPGCRHPRAVAPSPLEEECLKDRSN